MKRAFTYMELLVGSTIFIVLATITVLAGIDSWTSFFVTREVQEETSLTLEAMDRIQGTVRKAYQAPTTPILICPLSTVTRGRVPVVHARAISDMDGCINFSQGPTTLVLRLPSINSNGTIIQGSFDTVVYTLVGGDLVEVQRRTAGIRDNHDQDLIFTPSSVNFSLVRTPKLQVTATLAQQVTASGRTITRSLTRTMGARNAN